MKDEKIQAQIMLCLKCVLFTKVKRPLLQRTCVLLEEGREQITANFIVYFVLWFLFLLLLLCVLLFVLFLLFDY